jgi:hypothetical protein
MKNDPIGTEIKLCEHPLSTLFARTSGGSA